MPAASDATSSRKAPFPFGIPLDDFPSTLPGPKISTTKWLSNNANGELDDGMRYPRVSSTSRLAGELPTDFARTTRAGSGAASRPSTGSDGYSSESARVTRQRSSLPDSKVDISQNQPARSLRTRKSIPDDDGDDYQEEEDVDGEGEVDPDVEMEEERVAPRAAATRKTRRIVDSESDEVEVRVPDKMATVSTRGRSVIRPVQYASDEESFEDDEVKPKGSLSRGRREKDDLFVENDEEFDGNEEEDIDYGTARNSRGGYTRPPARGRRSTRSSNRPTNGNNNGPGRRTRKVDANYESGTPESTTEDDMIINDDDEDDEDDMGTKKKDYKLRQRQKKVNYLIPPADAYDIPVSKNDKGKGKSRRGPGSWMPANMSGAQYAALYPDKPQNGSDSVRFSPRSSLSSADEILGTGRRWARLVDASESCSLPIKCRCRRCWIRTWRRRNACRWRWY